MAKYKSKYSYLKIDEHTLHTCMNLSTCMYQSTHYIPVCTRAHTTYLYVPEHTLHTCMYQSTHYIPVCTRAHTTYLYVPEHTLLYVPEHTLHTCYSRAHTTYLYVPEHTLLYVPEHTLHTCMYQSTHYIPVCTRAHARESQRSASPC